MAKPLIKLHFQNGLNFPSFKKEVFDVNGVSESFDFEESAQPDFIIFGPYGNDIPAKGNYTRIGYFCENIKPDLSICDWAFGIPREEEISNPRYKRIQWHGLDPQVLIKPDDYNAEQIVAGKKHFCNFFYSHNVPYREAFFKQLSKYKKIDAPGRAMNNMAGIDDLYSGSKWERKRQFLSQYKFTIAFENDIYPGYQTEKLYDAMQANSIPVYCGDPFVGEIFNTKSFINCTDYMGNGNWFKNKLTRTGQMDFEDIRPAQLTGVQYRLKRKAKSIIRNLNLRLNFKPADFEPVIDRIIELDKSPDLYLKYLNEPWFKNNTLPQQAFGKQAWTAIFNTKII